MTEFVNDVFELFTLRPVDSGFRRNDGMNFKISTEPTMTAKVIRLSLRGAQRRGNLVEVEHVPGNHHCYGDEIATPVSSTGSQ